MPVEIERKFVVNPMHWSPQGRGMDITQGYLSRAPQCEVRIREVGNVAYLTIKSGKPPTRLEFEWRVPSDDARELLSLTSTAIIEKTRYSETIGGHLWTIDVFHGRHDGLLIAEVELQSEDEEVELPAWIEREVTNDAAYSNAALSIRPDDE